MSRAASHSSYGSQTGYLVEARHRQPASGLDTIRRQPDYATSGFRLAFTKSTTPESRGRIGFSDPRS